MREFILDKSFYWDPIILLAVLLLMFGQICSAGAFRRNILFQLGLCLFYAAAVTCMAAFYMLEPERDPRENLVIASVSVFFLSFGLLMIFAARGRIEDYGRMRAAFMLTLLGSTAAAAVLLYAYHGAAVVLPRLDIPFAVLACLFFAVCVLALTLEGWVYDRLVFKRTSLPVVCLYAVACTCGVFGYYIYMSRGLTRVFSL